MLKKIKKSLIIKGILLVLIAITDVFLIINYVFLIINLVQMHNYIAYIRENYCMAILAFFLVCYILTEIANRIWWRDAQ